MVKDICKPAKKVASEQAERALATSHRCFNICHNETRHEISVMVADTVALGFQCLHHPASFRLVVFGTAAEEHVVVHVFPETFVTVERMKLPSGVQLDSQTIDDDADEQENYNHTGY